MLFPLCVQLVLFAPPLEELLFKIALLVLLDIIVALLVWALFPVNFVVQDIFVPATSAFQTPRSSYVKRVSSAHQVLRLPQHASLEGSIS